MVPVRVVQKRNAHGLKWFRSHKTKTPGGKAGCLFLSDMGLSYLEEPPPLGADSVEDRA